MSIMDEIFGVTSEAEGAPPAGIVPFGGEAGGVLALIHGGGNLPEVPKPFAQPILLLQDTRVAGTTHVADIDELVEGLAEGDRLGLQRDSANPYDSFAIRVLDPRGRRLGFVPADRNEVPARLMDGGKRLYATVTRVELLGSWWKIGMAVYLDD